MLSSLHIENIAVVSECDIDFNDGFTVVTGETGSGKSIIVESISLLLGSPFKKEMLRTGETGACVCGVYCDISKRNINLLSEMGIEPDEDGCIYVQRDFSIDGKSKNRINGRQTSVTLLRQMSELLVNIHGQNDNQVLLNAVNHIDLLDNWCDNTSLINDYKTHYHELVSLRSRLKSAKIDDTEKSRQIELLKYQIEDISSLHLKPGEQEELESRRTLLKSSEKAVKHSKLIYRALYKNGKGASAYSLVDMAEASIEAISDIMPNADDTINKLDEIKSIIEDIAEQTNEIAEQCGENPEEELDYVETRLNSIEKLYKKYGYSIEEVLDFCENAKKKLDNLESSDLIIKELNRDISKEKNQVIEIAKQIHDKRIKGAQSLESLISNQLEFLDMKGARFVCDFQYDTDNITATGCDKVEFLLSANKGESPKPLCQIASGGELARIMLGIKSIFAEKEGTQTLIYDEIDTGISGKTSQKLGLVLHQCAQSSQVISVTHSAQIAAACDNHLLVYKSIMDERVCSNSRYLQSNDKINEIARIMGGNDITDQLKTSAKELVNETQKAFLERI